MVSYEDMECDCCYKGKIKLDIDSFMLCNRYNTPECPEFKEVSNAR